MPSVDKITLTHEDLSNLLVAVEMKNHQGWITIVDTGNSFTVRDSGDMKIAEVEKVKESEWNNF